MSVTLLCDYMENTNYDMYTYTFIYIPFCKEPAHMKPVNRGTKTTTKTEEEER